jgi:glyceraldehyde 3-phosphate dehydrogenase
MKFIRYLRRKNMIKVAINGFGRIGKNAFRVYAERKDINFEIVAINGVKNFKEAELMLKYDSVYGKFEGEVELGADCMKVNGKRVVLLNERDAEKLPWGELGVDIVIESTGAYTNAEDAKKHIKAGAKKVIISAPAKGEDLTIVMGVNDDKYDNAIHHVLSNASCTTNCLAPVAKVIDEKFGIEEGLMTTVHAYTNDQRVLDGQHKDPRRARTAAINMIPTTTGAAKAVALVLPQLKGKFNGMAVRVPTPTVSMIDLVIRTTKPVTAAEVNAAFKEASEGSLKGILGYTEEELVSMDFKKDDRSSIVDAPSTMTMGTHMLKVISWYDNEWGYSERIIDLAALVATKL